MNTTSQLFQKFRGPMQPNDLWYREQYPLCGRNKILGRRLKPTRNACSEHLQNLFACLKKWEYDDIPCSKQRDAYNNCIAEDRVRYDSLVKAELEAPIGTEESQKQKRLTIAQVNKLMEMFPQPELGNSPFTHRRLPNQPYYEDTFNTKSTNRRS